MEKKVNVAEKLALFQDYWHPRVVAELNGQHVKVVKLEGDFVWHHHEQEDELFLVLSGNLTIEFSDREVKLEAGEMIIVPRGVEHRPVARSLVEVLLFEPVSTVNTGELRNERTYEPTSI